MAFRLMRRLGLGFKGSLGRGAHVVALIVVSALITPAAEAQSDRSITVDNGVLDRLGPPPPAGKATTPRSAKPPAKTAIQLIPPKSRSASAAPKPPAKGSDQSSTPSKPAVTALTPAASSATAAVSAPPKPPVAPSEPAGAAAAPPAVAAAAPPPSMRVAPTAPAG